MRFAVQSSLAVTVLFGIAKPTRRVFEGNLNAHSKMASALSLPVTQQLIPRTNLSDVGEIRALDSTVGTKNHLQ